MTTTPDSSALDIYADAPSYEHIPGDYLEPGETHDPITVASMPDTVAELVAAADANPRTKGRPENARQLTQNLFEGLHRYYVHAPDGTKITKSHRALFWLTQTDKTVKGTDGDTDTIEVVENWTLWAPWTITDVKRIRPFDTSLNQWLDEADITTEGLNGTRTQTATPEDLIETRKLRIAFAGAGGIANADHAKNARHGDPLMQFRSIIEAEFWGPTVKTTERIGRVDPSALGTNEKLFVFPDLTIGANGTSDAIIYRASRPNVAAPYVRVTWNPEADLDSIAARHIEAALLADPSVGFSETAAVMGWNAAACFASEVQVNPLTGGFPLAFIDGVPGSGKSTRIPRLGGPVGQHPTSVSAGLTTNAQVRDVYTATSDVPFIRDELNPEYMGTAAAASWRETMKDAYNGRSKNVGGAFASAQFKLRSLRTSPAVLAMGERLPQSDPAIMDRLMSVSMKRIDNYDADTRERTAVGMHQLADVCANPDMASLAGAWYSWVCRNDIAPYLADASTRHIPGLENATNRNRPAIWCVLAGLDAYLAFLTEVAPAAAVRFAELVTIYNTVGVEMLTTRMGSLVGIGGAVAGLRSLALFTNTMADSPTAPKDGVHYRIGTDAKTSASYVEISSSAVVDLLRQNRQLEYAAPTSKAFTDEVGQWNFSEPAGRSRVPGPDGKVTQTRWTRIYFDGLSAIGGPSVEDFAGHSTEGAGTAASNSPF